MRQLVMHSGFSIKNILKQLQYNSYKKTHKINCSSNKSTHRGTSAVFEYKGSSYAHEFLPFFAMAPYSSSYIHLVCMVGGENVGFRFSLCHESCLCDFGRVPVRLIPQ